MAEQVELRKDDAWFKETSHLLTEATKRYPLMTPVEKREQLISAVMGFKGRRNTMSREEVKEMLDNRYGPVSG